jgi:Anti-sigma-28 factor, FlgM
MRIAVTDPRAQARRIERLRAQIDGAGYVVDPHAVAAAMLRTDARHTLDAAPPLTGGRGGARSPGERRFGRRP